MPWWAWLLIGFGAGIVATYAALGWAIGTRISRLPPLPPPKDSPNGQSLEPIWEYLCAAPTPSPPKAATRFPVA